MATVNLIVILTVIILMIPFVIKIQFNSRQNIKGKEIDERKILIIMLCLGVVLRLLFAGLYKGHESDLNCFIGWADRIVEVGPSGFYSSEVFTDYPPGYIYILSVIGWIRKIFDMGYTTVASLLLIKLPAIICDLVTGIVLYKTARKHLNTLPSLLCMAMYIFNPAVIMNSSVWGQVDAVFTLAIVLMCGYVSEKQLPKAYFAFALGILIKPQTLMFTPIILYGIYSEVFKDGFNKKKFFYELSWGLLAIISVCLLALPFGLGTVFHQYTDTITSYPYASVNAYNFWTLIGRNWAPQDEIFLFLKGGQWGTIAIIIIVIAATFIFLKSKQEKSRYFFVAAFIIISVFFFSVRMHERYMFSGIALLIFAFAIKPRKELYITYIMFSVVHTFNVAHVLFVFDLRTFNNKELVPLLISLGGILGVCYMVITQIKYYLTYNESGESAVVNIFGELSNSIQTSENNEDVIKCSKELSKITKLDIIAMIAIILVYAAVALTNLGDTKVPENGYIMQESYETILLDFGKMAEIKDISYYLGSYENRNLGVQTAGALEGLWDLSEDIMMSSVFGWGNTELNLSAQYICLTAKNNPVDIKELVFRDQSGNFIIPINASSYEGLFDEQGKFSERNTYKNSTYFDEIYHARTAYEYIGSLYSYENTHPPLGKVLISLGIRIFGMNPFGWRIIGTLFGIAMLPFLYLFAKRMFKQTWISIIVSTLFAFDFMHFTQTRIATIDVFVTFFIIVMYYCMYLYTQMSFYDTRLGKTFIPLGICGISMGLGIASKWTGIYAGCGLAVVFFAILYQRFKEYDVAKKWPTEKSNGISHREIIRKFPVYLQKTILFCFIFFILIPAAIYVLSYIPFRDGTDSGLIGQLVANQKAMITYHAGITATHPYSSWWYQWPIMYRPVWYYAGTVSDTVREGISAFGNPLVWWAGIPAFFYMIFLVFKKKDKTALFLIVSYLIQYIPWFFVTRITFMYHYFPSTPFIVLMLGYSMFKIAGESKSRKTAAFVYMAAAVALFIMFYPVLSGRPVSRDYVDTWLRWFDTWVLVG